jgi:hypothetical protein
MHDAMADADQAIPCKPLAQKRHQMLECAGVTELGPFTPRFLGGRLAGAIQGNEVRRGVKAFDLAALIELQFIPRTRKSENLMLDEPAFRTTMASGIRAAIRDSCSPWSS